MVLVPMTLMVPDGPPSELQIKLKPALKAVVICQAIVAICRLATGDIWGCICDLLVVLLGKWAITENNVEHIIWYGVACFFNGLFDSIRVVVRFAKLRTNYFDTEQDLQYNLASFAILAATILACIGAAICYTIYKDFERNHGLNEAAPFANMGNGAGYYAQRPPADSNWQRPVQQQPFNAFQGAGHRLDGGRDPNESQYLPPPPRTGERRMF